MFNRIKAGTSTFDVSRIQVSRVETATACARYAQGKVFNDFFNAVPHITVLIHLFFNLMIWMIRQKKPLVYPVCHPKRICPRTTKMRQRLFSKRAAISKLLKLRTGRRLLAMSIDVA